MNGDDPWAPVLRRLDEAADAERPVRFWLRDDDAVDVTPALQRLSDLCEGWGLPMLLAVIPLPARDRLGHYLADRTLMSPCQHGWRHHNHAASGQRACEIGGDRPAEEVLRELATGRSKLQSLFGGALVDVLVPPWNRIDPDLVGRLPDLGYSLLSTFGPVPSGPQAIRHLNCDIDVMDWRGGRVGRTPLDVAGKLGTCIDAAAREDRSIGLLTHHLAHDRQAWDVLDSLLMHLARHPGATVVRPF